MNEADEDDYHVKKLAVYSPTKKDSVSPKIMKNKILAPND